MRKREMVGTVVLVLSLVLFSAGSIVQWVGAADVPRMTKEDLNAKLGAANVVVLDVRADKDWKGSESKIKGAVREDPDDVKSWLSKYGKDKTLVFYCA